MDSRPGATRLVLGSFAALVAPSAAWDRSPAPSTLRVGPADLARREAA